MNAQNSSMKQILLMLLIALGGCSMFTPRSMETPTDRLKAACAEEGGIWTQGGCVVKLVLGVGA